MGNFSSASPATTYEVGQLLGKLLIPGDLICLIGDLGAGKTLLVKGMAVGLGVDEASITSPTFTLINEYQGVHPIYHFDVYRLDNPNELEDLGYEEYFFGAGVCIVEWGDQIRTYLPDHYLTVEIKKTSEQTRALQFRASGSRYQQLLRDFSMEVNRCEF